MPRSWSDLAIARIEADFVRSADTHLVPLPLPGRVDLVFKDETTHPSGSLKHRLARSLFLYHRNFMPVISRQFPLCRSVLWKSNVFQRLSGCLCEHRFRFGGGAAGSVVTLAALQQPPSAPCCPNRQGNQSVEHTH